MSNEALLSAGQVRLAGLVTGGGDRAGRMGRVARRLTGRTHHDPFGIMPFDLA